MTPTDPTLNRSPAARLATSALVASVIGVVGVVTASAAHGGLASEQFALLSTSAAPTTMAITLAPGTTAAPASPAAAWEAIAARYRSGPFAERVTIAIEPSAPGTAAKRATVLIAGDVTASQPELSVLHVDLGPLRLWLTPTRTLALPGLPPAGATATLAGAAPPPENPARSVMLLREGGKQALAARLDELVKTQRIGPVPAPHLVFFAAAASSAGEVELGGVIGKCRFESLAPVATTAPSGGQAGTAPSATITLLGRCDAGPVKVTVDRQSFRFKSIEATLADGKLTMEFRAVGVGDAVRVPQPPDLTPLRRVEILSELGRALAKPPADRRVPELLLRLADAGNGARTGTDGAPVTTGPRVFWLRRAGVAASEAAALTTLRQLVIDQLRERDQNANADQPVLDIKADGRISQETIDWLLGDADASAVYIDATGVATLVKLMPRPIAEAKAESIAKELLAAMGP